jgi:hypothetical protein
MDIYWNIFTMHGPMNLKFPNNTSKRQMGFNSAFKGLIMTKIQIKFFEYDYIACVLSRPGRDE